MPLADPSPLSKKIDLRVECFSSLPGTTFLRGIRKDVAAHGGWGAQGDVPPIMAFSCRLAHTAAYASMTSLKYRAKEFPPGIKSVFSDWWNAQSSHPCLDVEKIVVLSCARMLMSLDIVKEGDSTWKIAQRIAKSMDIDQRISAMKEAFRLAHAHPARGDRPGTVAALLAMGHCRPEIHDAKPQDGWRMLSACIEDVRSAGQMTGLHHLPMDLGAPGPEFYRHLPVDCTSVELMLRMTRGLLRQSNPDPVTKSEIARTMLVDLGEWVRHNRPPGGLDNPSLTRSWAKASSSPLFAPLEPLAMGIILACNVDAPAAPPRVAPRL